MALYLYKVDSNSLEKLPPTTFKAEKILERENLQEMFRENIEAIVPDSMVLAEEYGSWEGSRRRIDLLCLDKNARLIIVELKRTEDGGRMDLQAVRYAAMISTMSFTNAVQAHRSYLEAHGVNEDAETRILEFLEWDEQQDDFGEEVSIVLVSADFSQELMSSVMWLSQHDIDIRCIAIKPYMHNKDVLIDIEQRFPLPEARDYQVRIKDKAREERKARQQNRDLTRYDLSVGNDQYLNLPKRRLAYQVVQEAIKSGASPRDVLEDRKWIIVRGEHDQDSFEVAAATQREAESSTQKLRRFYTKDDELIFHEGYTYALTKMWGLSTPDTASKIIERFNLTDVEFRETPQSP